MWQFTTGRLLIATFWCRVAFAACLIETREPYTILLAGWAIAFALLAIIGRPQSERRATFLAVAIWLSAAALIGITFAILGR